MRAQDFITENSYGDPAARHPYGRGIRRGDTVRNVDTEETHTVVAIDGSKIALDNGEVVVPRDKYVVVKQAHRVDELYDPERKYTGGGQPPPPPRKRGGPDWGDDDERKRMYNAWRLFLLELSAELKRLNFIMIDVEPGELRVVAYYSTKNCGSILVDCVPGKLDSYYTALLEIDLFDTELANNDVEPNRTRKLRITLDDFDWAVSKIRTEMAVLKACQRKELDESVLTESATDVLYHATSSLGALKILRDGEFKLTASSGTFEHEYTVRNRPFFLSTSRSKVGDYHARYPTIGATVFALDGRWLGQRYTVRPMDYWASAWVNNKSGRTRESEDRVYSRKNTIPLTPVTSIHVYIQHQTPEKIERSLNPDALTRDFARVDAYRWAEIREMSQLAEQRNIPVYIYYDLRDWKTQNTARAEYPEDVIELQHGLERVPSQYTMSPTLARLVELITAQPGDALSPDADRLLYNIRWHYDTYKTLETDMHNSRKPSSSDYTDAVRVANYMTQHKLKNMSELVDALKAKWSAPK